MKDVKTLIEAGPVCQTFPAGMTTTVYLSAPLEAEPGSWLMALSGMLAKGTNLSAGMVNWAHPLLHPLIELKICQCWAWGDAVLSWTPGSAASRGPAQSQSSGIFHSRGNKKEGGEGLGGKL